jgi:phage-related protein
VELAKGIGQALPELIPAAVDAILTIVEGLIDNIDSIIDAGVDLMIGLAEGLINAIPRIIEKIPVIIEKLVAALIRSAPKIAEAGVKLITSLVKNLPQIIASIVKAIPNIITAIVKGFASGVSSMVQVGKDLLTGLGNGLVEGVKGVVEKAKSVAGNVLSAVKGFFGVSSPSKVFHGIGGFLMEGLANGITDSMGQVEDAMSDLDTMMYEDAPTSEMAVDTSTMTTNYGNDSGYFTVPRQAEAKQLTVVLELDRMTLGRAVYSLNNEETQRVGVRLAGGYA